ncbi:MAG: N-carbamoylputrescine amidase, partial [Labilithrix sp.]|nr:N-carbamoylputrescine amidase [Labilithrix sp.]
ELTVVELAAQLQRGERTSRSLVEAYLARIEAVDRHGPTLRSVLETSAEALADADAADAARRAGPASLGLLHGIPVLVKDNVDTRAPLQTTAGSLALLGTPPARDAALVERLRGAGAIVLGKTNLSEWANMRSSTPTSGWSARGGLTRNPHALDRSASGSSSGSAAAVAAGLGAFAIGTETDGSIVSPACVCGVVGLKPTVGLVSRAGIIPIAHSQDTAGPMTRSVADAALVLQVLADLGASSQVVPGRPAAIPDYRAALDAQGLRGKRLGAMRGQPWLTSALESNFEEALADLRKLGATVVDVKVAGLSELGDAEMDVLLFELRADLALYLEERKVPGLRTLDDLVAFDRSHAEELSWFGQELFERSAKKGPLTAAEYRKALATCRRLARTEGIDRLSATHHLDAFVAPTNSPAWIVDVVNGDAAVGSSSTVPAVAGYPSITVPSGEVRGLPLGIMFHGAAWSEPMLLRCAYAYEQATKHRRRPTYRAHTATPS